MFVGTFKGKGMVSSADVSFAAGITVTIGNAATYTSNKVITDTLCTDQICTISAPTGGIGQFKGLQ